MAALNLNSLTLRGDAINLNAMAAQGTRYARYARLAFGLPIGFDGWRLGLNASRLDCPLISKPCAGQNKLNDFEGATALNVDPLKDACLALGLRNSAGTSVQMTLARRVGHNPNPITNKVNRGAHQYGTLKINRIWITASQAF